MVGGRGGMKRGKYFKGKDPLYVAGMAVSFDTSPRTSKPRDQAEANSLQNICAVFGEYLDSNTKGIVFLETVK